MYLTSITVAVDDGVNDKLLSQEKLGIDEMQKEDLKHIKLYQVKIKIWYDWEVKKRDIRREYWVMRQMTCMGEQGKIDEDWQGLYIVDGIGSKGTYILGTLENNLE